MAVYKIRDSNRTSLILMTYKYHINRYILNYFIAIYLHENVLFYQLNPDIGTKIQLTVKTLISLKRRARAIWQHSRYPSNKRHYNALTLKLKRLLANHKSEAYANYASSLSLFTLEGL
ncbi:hypothetical protein ACI65C_012135 [Semiaphis heraclei]